MRELVVFQQGYRHFSSSSLASCVIKYFKNIMRSYQFWYRYRGCIACFIFNKLMYENRPYIVCLFVVFSFSFDHCIVRPFSNSDYPLSTGFLTWLTRQVPLVEQELFNPSTSPVFSENRVARSLVFYVMFCSSLFVLFSFIFWSLYCLSFFDLRLLITL